MRTRAARPASDTHIDARRRYKQLSSKKGPRAAAAARGAAAKERAAAAANSTLPAATDAPAAEETAPVSSAAASSDAQRAAVPALDPDKAEAALQTSWDRSWALCKRAEEVCRAAGHANTHVVLGTFLRGMRAVEDAVHAHLLQLEAGEQAAHQLQLGEGALAWWGITRLGASGLDSSKSRRATKRARAAEKAAAGAAAESDDEAAPQPFQPAEAEQPQRKRWRTSKKKQQAERENALPEEWMTEQHLHKVARWCEARKVPFEV